MGKVKINYFTPFSKAPIVYFDETNVCWNIADVFILQLPSSIIERHLPLWNYSDHSQLIRAVSLSIRNCLYSVMCRTSIMPLKENYT